MVAKRYFHMSVKKYAVDQVITGNGKDKVDPRIEAAMEDRRPKGRLSRRDAVYVRCVPDFERCGLIKPGHVYEVEPEAELHFYDLSWTGEMEKALFKQKHKNPMFKHYPDWSEDLLDTCCEGYWSGRPTAKPVWEGLARSAKVLKLLTPNPITVEQTRGGRLAE